MPAPIDVRPLLGLAGSEPFGASLLASTGVGVDLAQYGYVENEFLVSSRASVWAYDDSFTPVVTVPDVPFATRVLVRRPSDVSLASGVVEMEPLHPDLDSALSWAAIHPWIMREGHTWVGVTAYAPVARQLRELIDPVRYSEISLPQDGLEFDIVGRVALALRSGDVPGVEVRTLVLSGWSATGSFCRVFLQDGFHDRWRDDHGAPVVDGITICISSGGTGLAGYPPLSPGSPPLPVGDPRLTVSGHGAVVFEVLSEMESETNEPSLREDSDEPDDRYRLYPVAGTAHIELRPERLTNRAQFEAAGGEPFPFATIEPRGNGRLDLIARAAFEAQLRWLIDDVPAPHGGRFAFGDDFIEFPAGRFEPVDEGRRRTSGRALLRDDDGNVLGGVRTPWVQVPTASYAPHSTPVPDAPRPPAWMPFAQPEMLALLMGSRAPFPPEELVARYGSCERYLERFAEAAGRLVAEGLLLRPDADELIRDAPTRWSDRSIPSTPDR